MADLNYEQFITPNPNRLDVQEILKQSQKEYKVKVNKEIPLVLLYDLWD